MEAQFLWKRLSNIKVRKDCQKFDLCNVSNTQNRQDTTPRCFWSINTDPIENLSKTHSIDSWSQFDISKHNCYNCSTVLITPNLSSHQIMWKGKERKGSNRKVERLPVNARRNHGTQPVREERCNQNTDIWKLEGNCKEQDKAMHPHWNKNSHQFHTLK